MNKDSAFACKFLDSKWKALDHEKHMQKLKEMKSCLKIERPKKYRYFKYQAKKKQLIEGKNPHLR